MARLKIRHIDDVAAITPHGYLMGGDETEELARVIEEQLAAGNRKLLIDLIETVHLNSNALGVLTKAHARYQELGGQVRLCHLTDRIGTGANHERDGSDASSGLVLPSTIFLLIG